jgi:purine-nucleoside phosphorylase
LKKKHYETEDGKLEFHESEKESIIFIVIGKQKDLKDYKKIPKAVYNFMKNHDISHLALLCKAGGINTLLRVGNAAIISDYIDMTKSYERYFLQDPPDNPQQCDMSSPFYPKWRQDCVKGLEKWGAEYGTNVFTNGALVCTQAPFFESRAEIEAYKTMKADFVAHGVCPYVYYAKTLSIHYMVLVIVSNVYGSENVNFLNDDDNNLRIAKLADILIKTKTN